MITVRRQGGLSVPSAASFVAAPVWDRRGGLRYRTKVEGCPNGAESRHIFLEGYESTQMCLSDSRMHRKIKVKDSSSRFEILSAANAGTR